MPLCLVVFVAIDTGVRVGSGGARKKVKLRVRSTISIDKVAVVILRSSVCDLMGRSVLNGRAIECLGGSGL